ncbi:unnamed protein product [Microthlaspi erraticum]|uniref:O-fucosyltransferase family protein n=1 Tax=Microthlaspi erraticum TaxID=1685480 RepID=A0A6D2HDA4_9BRAS|nr:unnamed protein product [Microthlaspi erraticum]
MKFPTFVKSFLLLRMPDLEDSSPIYSEESGIPPVCKTHSMSSLCLTSSLEKKAIELLDTIPKTFLSLHLRFEPDIMVAYTQCEYANLSPSSIAATEAARVDRKPWTLPACFCEFEL